MLAIMGLQMRAQIPLLVWCLRYVNYPTATSQADPSFSPYSEIPKP